MYTRTYIYTCVGQHTALVTYLIPTKKKRVAFPPPVCSLRERE